MYDKLIDLRPPSGASRIHRHTTNRVIGLFFGRLGHRVRALHGCCSTFSSIFGYTCISGSPGETSTLPRMESPDSPCIRSTYHVLGFRGAIRLHLQHRIQPRGWTRAPRPLANVCLARQRAFCPLCEHAAGLPSGTRWHGGTGSRFDNRSNYARIVRLSSMASCGRRACTVAPCHGTSGRDVV